MDNLGAVVSLEEGAMKGGLTEATENIQQDMYFY